MNRFITLVIVRNHKKLFSNNSWFFNGTFKTINFQNSIRKKALIECGIDLIEFSDKELETNDSVDDMNLECFEYVNIISKVGLRKKLMLVKKKTKPGYMIQYFQNLLKISLLIIKEQNGKSISLSENSIKSIPHSINAFFRIQTVLIWVAQSTITNVRNSIING
jgi:hypothetical protein